MLDKLHAAIVGTQTGDETEPPSAGELIQIDEAAFAANFDRRPFKISHRLAHHPLLQLPRLVRLAETLSPARGKNSILYFRADHEINQASYVKSSSEGAGKAQGTFVGRNLEGPKLSVEETVAQIESCNAWMQIRNVGMVPEYGALLDAIMLEFGRYAERVSPGISETRADIFVSSPGATTPFHLDEEHNFLLQVRGTKKLSIADGSNRSVLSESHLIDFYHGHGELAPYAPHLEEFSEHVDLSPGEGVHIPPCYPHWVKNGGAVSVSLGILWHSDVTARQRALYRVNDWLRRAGVRPSPTGQAPLIEALKVAPFRIGRRAKRSLKKRWRQIGGA